MDYNDDARTDDFSSSNIGNNIYHLIDVVESLPQKSLLVDIGIRGLYTSTCLLHKSLEHNSKVIGIDIRQDLSAIAHPNYEKVVCESVTAAKRNVINKANLVFIDTTHCAPQTLCELYGWWPKIKLGGWIGFHDTDWDVGFREVWCGVAQRTVSDALCEFFNITDLGNRETDVFKMFHYRGSCGLTMIQKLKEYRGFVSLDWSTIFKNRNAIIDDLRHINMPADVGFSNPEIIDHPLYPWRG